MFGEERVYWDNGAVFGLAYFLAIVPLAIGATLWFYRRRSVQPIKARSPRLVVLTDIVLILYISLLWSVALRPFFVLCLCCSSRYTLVTHILAVMLYV